MGDQPGIQRPGWLRNAVSALRDDDRSPPARRRSFPEHGDDGQCSRSFNGGVNSGGGSYYPRILEKRKIKSETLGQSAKVGDCHSFRNWCILHIQPHGLGMRNHCHPCIHLPTKPHPNLHGIFHLDPRGDRPLRISRLPPAVQNNGGHSGSLIREIRYDCRGQAVTDPRNFGCSSGEYGEFRNGFRDLDTVRYENRRNGRSTEMGP